VEHSFVTPARVRALINSSFDINSTIMFSYPPRLLIRAHDNLVLVLPSSPTMPPAVSMGLGMEMTITT
jgi:hypothetical protein